MTKMSNVREKGGRGKARPEGLLRPREALHAYANLRPCRLPSRSLHSLDVLKDTQVVARVEFILVRENCGGAYFGAKVENDDFVNRFGDILSDEASVITGSFGLLPSASLSGIPSPTGAAKGFMSLCMEAPRTLLGRVNDYEPFSVFGFC